MTFPSYTFPAVSILNNYKSILYTKKQIEEFGATKAKLQRAYSFFLHYDSFSIFDITSHMIYWPEDQESQEVKEYSFFCFYNEQLKYNAEKKEHNHKIFTMTKHCFDNPFIIRGLIVGSELFFFSTIEYFGTCQIHFDQNTKSFFSHNFSYQERNIMDFKGVLDQNVELKTIDKIKASLENFFHVQQK